MYKLGKWMYIASILLLIGWTSYKFWQTGNTDGIIALFIVVLFVVGVLLIFTSGKV